MTSCRIVRHSRTKNKIFAPLAELGGNGLLLKPQHLEPADRRSVGRHGRHSMRCTPRPSSVGKICLFIARVTSRITSSQRPVPHIQPEPMPDQIGTKPPTAAGSRRCRCAPPISAWDRGDKLGVRLRAAFVDRRPHLGFVSSRKLPSTNSRPYWVSPPIIVCAPSSKIELTWPSLAAGRRRWSGSAARCGCSAPASSSSDSRTWIR